MDISAWFKATSLPSLTTLHVSTKFGASLLYVSPGSGKNIHTFMKLCWHVSETQQGKGHALYPRVTSLIKAYIHPLYPIQCLPTWVLYH